METATKPPQVLRPADRVLEALATLAALLDRTMKEVKTLDDDFQGRLLEAVHDTEASVRSQAAQHLKEKLSEVTSSVRQETADELKADFEKQLETSLHALRTEFDAEQQRLNQQLVQAVETAAELERERSALLAEIRLAVTDAPPATSMASVLIQEEIQRVEAKVREISVVIDDPDTELTSVIRMNVERSDLEAYLRGIRLVIGR